MILNQNLWNIIAIVVFFDTLHNDCKTIITSFLKTRNKLIDKI